MIFTSAVVLSLIASASAGCDNSCSGHGECDCGFCKCYDNWGMGMAYDTGDCSDRICPFELSWVDTPDASGVRHKYQECAGKGLCNRDSGECECFAGYEGKGCQRTACPNDCSGHGTCEYIEDLTFGATEFDYPHNEFTQTKMMATYNGWDEGKTRGCLCDPQYADVDCSKRMCPYGNDMMDRREDQITDTAYQTQKITMEWVDDDSIGGSFGLTFKSKINETYTTNPITFTGGSTPNMLTLSNHIEAALLNLPNGIIDGVHVHSGHVVGSGNININVTFTGNSNQGQQNLLVVEDYKCADGCFPKLDGIHLVDHTGTIVEHVEADYNSFECGRRGKCDYESGVCQCFEGFTGPSCGTCTSLI